MILLDADILVLDIRYPRDARFAMNERLLTTLQEHEISRGITLYALLEVIGILSFNLPTDQVQKLFALLPKRYGLQVVPALETSRDQEGYELCRLLVDAARRVVDLPGAACVDSDQGRVLERFAEVSRGTPGT